KYEFQEVFYHNITQEEYYQNYRNRIHFVEKPTKEQKQSTFLQELIEIDNKSIIIYGKIPRPYNPIYNKKVLNRVTNPPNIEILQEIRKQYNQLQQIIKTLQLIEIPLLEKEGLTLQNAYENNKRIRPTK
ncbi:1140_t:CDS:2, partial [Ambispora leptoticha]